MRQGLRRRLGIALHWSVALALLAMIKGGTAAPWVRWSFVALAAVWLAVTLSYGMRARPGTKLRGFARSAFFPAHLALHTLVAAAAALNAGELLGLIAPGPGWISLLVLLSAASFHAIFHLWRHAALYDNALRPITPRFMHKYL